MSNSLLLEACASARALSTPAPASLSSCTSPSLDFSSLVRQPAASSPALPSHAACLPLAFPAASRCRLPAAPSSRHACEPLRQRNYRHRRRAILPLVPPLLASPSSFSSLACPSPPHGTPRSPLSSPFPSLFPSPSCSSRPASFSACPGLLRQIPATASAAADEPFSSQSASDAAAAPAPHTPPASLPHTSSIVPASTWHQQVALGLARAIFLGCAAASLLLCVPARARAQASRNTTPPVSAAAATAAAAGAGPASSEDAPGGGAEFSSFPGLPGGTPEGVGKAGGGKAGAKAEEGKQSAKQAAAVEMLEGFLKKHPDDVDALKMMLRVRLKAAEFESGLQVLDVLMRLQPQEREWKFLQAQLLEYSGDLSAARRGFEEILASEPFSARALQGLASVMRKSGEDSLVLGMVERAVGKAEEESKLAEVTNLKLLLGQLHALQGNVGEAVAQYDKIMEDNPRDFRAYLCKGLVLSLSGEWEKAEQLFIQFRQRCPKAYAPYLDNVIVRSSVEARRRKMEENALETQSKQGRRAKALKQPGNVQVAAGVK